MTTRLLTRILAAHMSPHLPLAALALTLVGAVIARGVPAPEAAHDARQREWVMGTIAEIHLFDRWPAPRAAAALEAAFEELRAVDRLMAVQRPGSDVSRLNRDGAAGPVHVDARVVEVIVAAERVSALTDGAFDVTVLPLVDAWGFLEGSPHRPVDTPERRGSWRALRLDLPGETVAFERDGVGVDLGGIAKGYALDRARGILLGHGVTSAYLDLGGNVATIGCPPDAPVWRIGIRHPRRSGELIGFIEIGEASVSTSGDAERFLEDDEGRVGHVFDPRTGAPADTLVSATVVAASATVADALSTAAIVLGREKLLPVLDRVGGEALLARLEEDGTLDLTASAGLVFDPGRPVSKE